MLTGESVSRTLLLRLAEGHVTCLMTLYLTIRRAGDKPCLIPPTSESAFLS